MTEDHNLEVHLEELCSIPCRILKKYEVQRLAISRGVQKNWAINGEHSKVVGINFCYINYEATDQYI